MISIVIPTFNALEYTKKCLQTLHLTNSGYELIIVDDGSTDGTRDFIASIGCKYLFHERNMGLHHSWNDGIRAANSETVCVANSDILFTKDWDIPLLESLDDDTWVVSPYHTDGAVPADFPVGSKRKKNHLLVLGSCFMAKKSTFEFLGYFPTDMRLWYGDNWLGDVVTLKHHKKVSQIPSSYVHHFISKSVGAIPPANMHEDHRIYKELRDREGF